MELSSAPTTISRARSTVFLNNGTNFTPLDVPVMMGTNTNARDISGSQIVGFYSDASSIFHGFIFDDTNYTPLTDPNVEEISQYMLHAGLPPLGRWIVAICVLTEILDRLLSGLLDGGLRKAPEANFLRPAVVPLVEIKRQQPAPRG